MIEIKRKTFEVEGVNLAVFESGRGEAVVFLHGYVGSHLTWEKERPILSGRFRIITLDWFGWGDSGRSEHLDYSYEAEVGRLAKLIEAMGLDRLHLVGHDYGGLLALGYAKAHPRKLLTLTVSNTRAYRTFKARWYPLFCFLVF